MMKLTIASLILPLAVAVSQAPAHDRPNVVLIDAGDFGYGDVSAYAHPENVRELAAVLDASRRRDPKSR